MTIVELEGWLSPSVSARQLGISKQRLMQLVAAGRLHPKMTPLGRVFSPDEIERVREERQSVK